MMMTGIVSALPTMVVGTTSNGTPGLGGRAHQGTAIEMDALYDTFCSAVLMVSERRDDGETRIVSMAIHLRQKGGGQHG